MYARIETSERLEELTDAELVRRFQAGNDSTFEELLLRHSDALYRFCRHLTGDPHDAEDICQETVVRAFARIGTLQSGSAFRSWIFSVARNLAIDSHRAKRKTCPMPEGEVLPSPLRADPPLDGIEIREERQTVAEALARLADRHQQVLVLREVDGLSYDDIAQELNVSHSAVETLLFRARRRLREEYGKVGATALVGSLRGIAGRVLAPASAPAALKLSVSAAIVGTTLLAAPHIAPPHRLIPLPQPVSRHHSGVAPNTISTPTMLVVPSPVRRPAAQARSPAGPLHRRRHSHHRVRVSAQGQGTHHARHRSATHQSPAIGRQRGKTHRSTALVTMTRAPRATTSASSVPTAVYAAQAAPTTLPVAQTAKTTSSAGTSARLPSTTSKGPEGAARAAPQSAPVATNPPQYQRAHGRKTSASAARPGPASPSTSSQAPARHSQGRGNVAAQGLSTPSSTTEPASTPTETAPVATSPAAPGKSGQAPGRSGDNPGHGG